jgi:hypothetical protein
MNTNPKTLVAVNWADLKTSEDLTDFITDQMQDDDKDYLTRGWIADTLEMLKDLDDADPEGDDRDRVLTNELAKVAKLMKDKRIDIFLM